MKTLAFSALIAAALAVSGCAKPADDANAAARNDVIANDGDGAATNLSAIDPLDGNATATSSNAL
ncbi:hypothetical protein [Sphingomonas sp. NFR15]|uniref:hypothetical protein n=1 Tax=Sphingomonas sp. NFR15 TaxID=1566282 RepID=UPI00088F39AA|nr:hypothetical protein [Sphingomonas sp. NFR15]SDA32406.1 hypothetical protein SAMN03159340_02786 [Sphingomonas sp. NFR15]